MKEHGNNHFLFGLVAAAVASVQVVTAAAQSVVYVDDDAPVGGDGLSWPTAFDDLQDALDLARSDPTVEEIWVAGGTYWPDRGTGDRAATFALVSNVGVYGGFHGNEVARTPRAERTSETALSGDIGVPGDSSDNSKAIVSSLPQTERAIIENMEIAHGNGTWGSGADVHAWSTGIEIIGCRFRNNTSTWGGAVLISTSDECRIVDCDFESNTANHGGGVYLNDITTPTEIVNCRFYNNHAYGFNGGISNVSSYAVIRNCTFVNNSAEREGGALGNNGAESELYNCILWNNTPNEIRLYYSTTTAEYSCITGGWPGEGNIDIDPGFLDESAGDLRLAPNSPCIDAADNNAVPAEITLDLDFNARFVDDAGTIDTGNGTSPIVDMGCYEFQEASLTLLEPTPGEAGQFNRFSAIGADPDERIWFVYGRNDGTQSIPACPELVVEIESPKLLGSAIADDEGVATFDRFVPKGAAGIVIFMQAGSLDRCVISPMMGVVFE